MSTYKVITSDNPKAKAIANQFKKKLAKSNLTLAKNQKPKYLFVIGGDGTFIKEVIKYDYDKVNVIGINGGNLGFYSAFCEANLDVILDKLADLKFVPIHFLKVTIGNRVLFGVNELSITSSTAYPLDVSFNNSFYEKFRGTGLLVATRTGSTGYAKSARGAVIFPGVECLEFVELNPLLHTDFITIQSPLILPIETKIKIQSPDLHIDSASQASIFLDGKVIENQFVNNVVEIQAIKTKAKFLLPNTLESFINKLQRTFIKG